MPSAFSAKYRFELPATNEKINVWGPIVNQNTGPLLEQALDGYLSIAMSDANLTLSLANALDDQARNRYLRFTGSLTATRDIFIPATSRTYVIWNQTTQAINIKTASGTAANVPIGARMWVICDGQDTQDLTNFMRLTGGSIVGMSSISANEILRGASNLADFSQNAIFADYTLADSDRHRAVHRTGAAPCTVLIPLNATIPFPLGTTILVTVAEGASDMVIAPIGAVVLRQAGSATTGSITLSARSAVWLLKVGVNEWFLVQTPTQASGGLLTSNNLSDVPNKALARTNLALGTAAQATLGTSGATVPLLDNSNTHTDARGQAAAATSDLQLGFRRLRPATITSGYPVASDSDSCVYAGGAVGAPANVFVRGDCFLVVNTLNTAMVFVQGPGVTLRQEGTANTGDRIIRAYGRAAILYLSPTEAIIGGAIT